jgi:hypothetical protein
VKELLSDDLITEEVLDEIITRVSAGMYVYINMYKSIYVHMYVCKCI